MLLQKATTMTDIPARTGTHAIVIGGSLAGMLAAAAVKDRVDTVEIIEAHDLPLAPQARTGVPQAAHIHPLLSGGAKAIDMLLPGTIASLLDAGANRVPMTTNMVYLSPEGWYRRWQRDTHYLIAASRDLTDSVIRRHVLSDARVKVRSHARVVSLLGDAHRVTGVKLRTADGSEHAVYGDVVIDASGRSTRTPRWLADLGITDLVEDHIDSGMAYASRVYRAPVPTANWPLINVLPDPALPGPAGGILPIEQDRWHVSVYGPPGSHPGREPEGFEAYVRSLRHPIVSDLLKHAEPLTDVTITHSTANHRFYYERLKAWPEGLIALGDSVAAFNPIYGHGMSVAAQGALAIRDVLTAGLFPGFARQAQRAVSRPINVAWSLAVGQDVLYATTTGKQATPADRLLHSYVSRLSRTATGNFRVATALTDVLTLEAPPAVLLRPDILLASIIGPLRPPHIGPGFTAQEHQLLKRAGVQLS
ncbi:pyridine nucleotide-disulfide oxidoreductase [Streptomyces sp. NPDC005195]|uniref:NAD(P)/FAD-dependent oxidoreductase n=1 Tax=Streptomyces sp. NPDC005195 TaxID=3154561 RepID=UPI0033BD219A